LKGANVGNSPPANLTGTTPYWLEVSSTNRWKMFDDKVESQTENASYIEVVLQPGRINSVVFLNVDASSINIKMTDPVEGEVYNETIQLEATEQVLWEAATGWESGTEWQGGAYFDLSGRASLKLDLPFYLSNTLTVTLSSSGIMAKCGAMIVGTYKNLGRTKKSPSIGIIDYSVKAEDSFGNFSITERSFAKRTECDFEIDTPKHSEVLRLLALYRATPIVWILSELYNTTILYGFYKEFSISVLDSVLSECSLSVEGMV
jgi:hypothetical protein